MAAGRWTLPFGLLGVAVLFTGRATGQNCSVFGNMHVLTFDGKDLNFQYPCKYSLVKTCSKLAPVNVDVRVKTKMLNGLGAVGLQYVEIVAEGQLIQLYPNGSIYNNDLMVQAYNYKCRLIVQRGPIGIEATIVGANMTVVVNEYGLVLVRATSMLRTFLCGLCGNFDGDPANDRIAASSYSAWFLTDASDRNCISLPRVDTASLNVRIDSCAGRYDLQGRHTCDWFNQSSTSQFRACSTSSRQLATAFYGFCVYDMCLAGTLDEEGSGALTVAAAGRSPLDEAVTCRLADAYALQCYARGRPPYGWRDSTSCAKSCPRGSAYSTNATACPAACTPSSAGACGSSPQPASCSSGYTEGCVCPANDQWSGATCAPKGTCGCSYAGAYYSEGASWLDSTCSNTVQCSNGKLTYSPMRCAAKSSCVPIAGAMQCVCPAGYTGDGRRQCTYVCGPGRYVNPGNDGCIDCPIGTYKPGQNGARACVACPNGQITSGTASVNESQCTDLQMLSYRNASAMCRTYDCLKRVYPPTNILKQGVPFGSQQYKMISVSSNGLITFGADFVGRTPGSLRSATNGIPAVAPMWLRQDFRRFPLATIAVGEYSIRDSQTDMLQAVNKVLSTSSQIDSSFSAIWAVVVTWQNAAPLQQLQTQLSQTASYQAIIATDSLTTYAAFLYPEGGLNIANTTADDAYMGYTSGGKQNAMQYNFYGGGTALMGRLDVISSNTGSPGTWVFKVSSGRSSPQQRDCLQWYALQASVWTVSKPTANKCPCNYATALADPGFRTNQGSRCTTSTFPDKLYGFYLTCCYDTSPKGRGRLLTGASDPGGPTQYSPYSSTASQAYNVNDKKPFTDCCVQSQNCNLYRQYRPATSCSKYVSPKSGAGRGDPHFRTIDGLYYTYNGIGEFHLLRSRTMSIQIRLGKVAGQQASEIRAIVAKASDPDSSCVHVEVNPYKTGVFAVIKSPSPGAAELKIDVASRDQELAYNHMTMYTRAGAVRAAFDNGFTLDIGLPAGMMQYTLYVPSKGNVGNTSGLLGRYDGSMDNDLTLPNGTILRCPGGLNDSLCIFNDFGPAWRITQADSMFWYAPGYSTASYTDLRFVPLFIEGKPTQPQVFEFCGGNAECIYDLVATGNRTVAASTLALYSDDRDTVKLQGARVPTLRVDRTYLKAVVGFSISFTVDVIPGSSGNASLAVVAFPNGAQLSNVSEFSYYFTWMPRDISSNSPIRLVAFDAENMTSGSVQIKVALCPGCGTNGMCMWPAEDDFDDSTVVSCNCTIGWRGPSCELDADGCADEPCVNGTCIDLPPGDQQHACVCHDGFELAHDSSADICVDIDECRNPSINKCEQLCNNTIGSYRCACTHGFQMQPDGVSCQPTVHSGLLKRAATEDFADVDECSIGSPCGNGSTCHNTIGSYTCSCGDGYEETIDKLSCQACLPGWYGQNCSYQCDCAARADTCDHVLGCKNCHSGWTGYQCNDDVNECDSPDTCHGRNSVCVNTPGSYRCECSPGYMETNSSGCVDIDECLDVLDPCPGGGFACTNSDGSFVCTCPVGYRLIGTECIDINECVGGHLCDVNAECQNTMGSYTCRCQDGYSGDGRDAKIGGEGCADVDECAAQIDVCPARSVCMNSAGSYECRCSAGHIAAGQCCIDSGIQWIHSSACSEVTVCCNAKGQYSSYCTADFEATMATQYSCTTLAALVAPVSPTFVGTTKAQFVSGLTDPGSIGAGKEFNRIMPVTLPLTDEVLAGEGTTQPTSKTSYNKVGDDDLDQSSQSRSSAAEKAPDQRTASSPSAGEEAAADERQRAASSSFTGEEAAADERQRASKNYGPTANTGEEESAGAYETGDAYAEDIDGMSSYAEPREEEESGAAGPASAQRESARIGANRNEVRNIHLMHTIWAEVTGESNYTSISQALLKALESFYRPLPGFVTVKDLTTRARTYDPVRGIRDAWTNAVDVNYTCVFVGSFNEIDDSFVLMQVSAYMAALNGTFSIENWQFTIQYRINYLDENGLYSAVDCGICGGTANCQLYLGRFPVCECCRKSWISCFDKCLLEYAESSDGHLLPYATAAVAASAVVVLVAAVVFFRRRKAKCSESKLGPHGFNRSISTECTQPRGSASTIGQQQREREKK